MFDMDTHSRVQTNLIEKSAKDVFQKKGQIAELFYKNLLNEFPQYAEHFSNMHKQKFMFEAMLAYCISGLTQGVNVKRLTARLAGYHTHLNLTYQDLANAKQALLSAIHEIVGDGFDAESEAAWGKAFDLIGAEALSIQK